MLARNASVVVCALAHGALASCTSSEPAPAAPGPVFVINSPIDGASVSGATFFSVQPFNPDEVQSVRFTAGATELTADFPGEDSFKVFLIPRDFPDGPLTLRATVTGKDGGTGEQSVTIQVVADPPSSATVTNAGAVLGTREENGAVSTLSIPAGVAEGAAVSFSARTKAEVKAATGIDYDALGVTFLGAQEISSDKTIQGAVGVSSGGFGPMVQPGQAVLNYLIVADRDGDGIGELVAMNGASVAPNGEVVSNPVPRIVLDVAAATGTAAARGARLLQAGPLAGPLGGPPGSNIEIEATGFNPASRLGNVAIFKSLVDGTEVEIPATVNGHVEEANAVPTLNVNIPFLPPGQATVTLRNVSVGTTAGPLTVTVEPAAALAKDPAAVIDDALAEGIRVLSKDPGSQDLVARLTDLRSQFAEIASHATADDMTILTNAAVFISGSNMSALLGQIDAAIQSGVSRRARGGLPAGPMCPLAGAVYGELLIGYSGVVTALGTALLVVVFVAELPITLPLGAAFIALSEVGGGAFGVGLATVFACTSSPPAKCAPPASLAGFLPTPVTPSSIGGVRAQAAPPNPITGMGSLIPPGGEGCGCVEPESSFSTSGLRSLARRPQGASASGGPRDLTGRFVVKVFFGAGSSVPFSGVSDSSGYFYIPTIPAGQPFQAIAFDTETGNTRSVEGVGPDVGGSIYLPFDFSTGENSGATVLVYGTNAQATYGDVDIYAFEGQAGDVVNLAAFSETSPVDAINYELSDPTGRPMLTGSTSGGHFFELGADQFLVELPSDGLYGFSVDGTSVQGSYTLGLSKMEPVAIDATSPVVAALQAVGERQYYKLTGHAGDALTVTLSAAVLNAELKVRGPQPGTPFYRQLPVLLKLFTFGTERASSGSITLTDDGDYIIEVKHDNPFEPDLATYLGDYRIEIVKTP